MFKKLLFSILVSSSFLITISSPAFALKFGPHMVCNTNPQSFIDVRTAYNEMNGWTDNRNAIPATMIFQTTTPVEVLTAALITAKTYNIIPYIRLTGPGFWDQISQTEALNFANSLNTAAGTAGLTGIYVAPGNEINRSDEWTGGDKIDSLAIALMTLLDNAKNYKVAFPGLDLYYPSSWQAFLTDFNNRHHDLLVRLATSGAFVAHSYTEVSNKNPNKWQEEQSFLSSVSVSPKFLFYEANLHPGINADAKAQAEYIKQIFPVYNLNPMIEVVTPFSRAHPVDNTASDENPYLMLVIKDNGSEAEFIPFPHPAENCGGSPNIVLKSTVAGGDQIIHQKSIIDQILEALKIFISGQTGFPEGSTNANSPNFQPVSQTLNTNPRLLPASLQKKITRGSGEIPADYAFPNCNAENDEQKKSEGKSTTDIFEAKDVSNALILNDLLNTTSDKNPVQRKATKTNFPYNYAIDFEKGDDSQLYVCGPASAGETLEKRSASLANNQTDWQGNFNETGHDRVLAAVTGPASPTTIPVQNEHKFSIVNQAKTKTFLTEVADAVSGQFGFLTALMPASFPKNYGLAGKVKNTVKTVASPETTTEADLVIPRAGEMTKTNELFKKMLLPQALQK